MTSPLNRFTNMFKTPGKGHDAIAQSITDFQVNAASGEAMPLSAYAGQVVLVVNVASKCGLTPQYAGLEQLYRTYHDRGLVVLGCPCNQFGGQEPGTEAEIMQFCSLSYDVTFPLTEKMDVNGAEAHPLWDWLKREKTGVLGSAIKWNFTKFLVGRDGRVVQRFAPTDAPESLASAIEDALAA
jgi:glutathione peroxidase